MIYLGFIEPELKPGPDEYHFLIESAFVLSLQKKL